MHVTACLAGQKEVEVGEDCRTTQALREAIVVALPQLCVDGFDVCVGGRELDDEGVVSLEENVALDVSANTHGLSVLALREAGREVSEDGLREAAEQGDVGLCTLYLDAGVPIDCVDNCCQRPLHLSCRYGHVETVRLLLDRGSAAIDEKALDVTPLFCSCLTGHVETVRHLLDRGSAAINEDDHYCRTPLHISCLNGHLEIATLLLDRGSTAFYVKDCSGRTPLHVSCRHGHLAIAALLLDRGSAAIDEIDGQSQTPLSISCHSGHVEIARLLLDRGSTALVETYSDRQAFSEEVVELLSDRMGEQ